MDLPKEPTPRREGHEGRTILIYGQPKIGKSTFASKFPGALFLECEPGLSEMEVYKVQTYTWSAFLDACAAIAAGKHDFKTIVVDTCDNAYIYCTEYILKQHGIAHEDDLKRGKGWAFVRAEWHRVLAKLAGLPYTLIMVSHARENEIETRTGKIVKTFPSLPSRARGTLLGLVDIIALADVEVANNTASDDCDTMHVLRCRPHPAYEAGDRTGKLPDTLPLDYEAFDAALRGKEEETDAP